MIHETYYSGSTQKQYRKPYIWYTKLVATKNKTLIKDIGNPVEFTVSITGIACVGSATFSKTCYEKQNKHIQSYKNGCENMAESNENRFLVSANSKNQRIIRK